MLPKRSQCEPMQHGFTLVDSSARSANCNYILGASSAARSAACGFTALGLCKFSALLIELGPAPASERWSFAETHAVDFEGALVSGMLIIT